MELNGNNLVKLSDQDLQLLVDGDFKFYRKLKSDLKVRLKNHFIDTCFFSYIPDSYCRLYNWRSPFATAHTLGKCIKGKHLCSVGCAYGEVDLVFSKYTEKMTLIDFSGDKTRIAREYLENGRYACPTEVLTEDFFKSNIDADVYYFFNNVNEVSVITDYILKLKKTLPPKDRFIIYTCYEVTYANKTFDHDCKSSEYYLIPFDEKFDLSFYADEMLTNGEDVAIIDKNKIFLYNRKGGELVLKTETNSDNFDKTGFKKYTPPFLLEGPTNLREGYTANLSCLEDRLNMHLQCENRGYIPIRVIKF